VLQGARENLKNFCDLPCKNAFHDGLGEAEQPNFYVISK